MPHIHWLYPLKCKDFMLFFAIHDTKQNIFGFLDHWLNKITNLNKSPSAVIAASYRQINQ